MQRALPLLLLLILPGACISTDDAYERRAGKLIARYFPDVPPPEQGDCHSLHMPAFAAGLSLDGEKPLRKHAIGNGRVYRFLWSGAFDPCGLTVRIIPGKSLGLMVAIRGVQRVERFLSDKEMCGFEKRLARLDVGTMARSIDRVGCDGGSWVLEVYADGQYRSIERWSPEAGPFKELCEYIAGLPHFAIKEIY